MKTEYVPITEFGPDPVYYVWVNLAKRNYEPRWALTEPLREFGSVERASEAIKDYCHDYEYCVIRSEYRLKPKPKENHGLSEGGTRQRAYAPRMNRRTRGGNGFS